MRRSLAAATLALLALATPASAGVDVRAIVDKYLGECMDCFPQIECVTRPCGSVNPWTLLDLPPVPPVPPLP